MIYLISLYMFFSPLLLKDTLSSPKYHSRVQAQSILQYYLPLSLPMIYLLYYDNDPEVSYRASILKKYGYIKYGWNPLELRTSIILVEEFFKQNEASQSVIKTFSNNVYIYGPLAETFIYKHCMLEEYSTLEFSNMHSYYHQNKTSNQIINNWWNK